MKTFNSITDFIKYYDTKQKIPKDVSFIIDGTEHVFSKTSRNNMASTTKHPLDYYRFIEKETYGLGIELTLTYYRYFEAKRILEAYFTFYHDEDVLFLSPIYFFGKFVNDDDFEHCKSAVSDSLEKWTGLKWVNVNVASDAFSNIRSNAYNEAQKDLFYSLPVYIYGPYADEPDTMTKYLIDEQRKKKWLIDKKGESPYFNQTIEVPETW